MQRSVVGFQGPLRSHEAEEILTDTYRQSAIIPQSRVNAPQHVGGSIHQPIRGFVQPGHMTIDEFLHEENPAVPVMADIAALQVFQKAAGGNPGLVQVFAQRGLLLGMVDFASGRKLHHHFALLAADEISVGACAHGGFLRIQWGQAVETMQQLIHTYSSLGMIKREYYNQNKM